MIFSKVKLNGLFIIQIEPVTWWLIAPELKWQGSSRVGIYPELSKLGRILLIIESCFFIYWLVAKHSLYTNNL